MDKEQFRERLKELEQKHENLIHRKNVLLPSDDGIISRYKYPVVTAAHTPLFWRFDLDYRKNPHLLERLGINATFNCGAIELNNKILLVVRVEGRDRKSFFAVAESETGVDHFRFWDYPIDMPPYHPDETNIYDMRLTAHEDGWIYGVFCTEKKDPQAPESDQHSAVAQAGIARTKDLKSWQRLPDLKTPSSQQRNVVLHPEFINGQYAFYTRPQQSFIDVNDGRGIGWGLCKDIEHAEIEKEIIIEERRYHTINEYKNGLGPAPIKTQYGWLHLAHGVRMTAAGLRYVLYTFMTKPDKPWELSYRPAGYLMAPLGEERVGDVSNVLFSNGWILRDNGEILIYYASSDTRCHVAATTLDKLVDFTLNTPSDGLYTNACLRQRMELIRRNLQLDSQID